MSGVHCVGPIHVSGAQVFLRVRKSSRSHPVVMLRSGWMVEWMIARERLVVLLSPQMFRSVRISTAAARATAAAAANSQRCCHFCAGRIHLSARPGYGLQRMCQFQQSCYACFCELCLLLLYLMHYPIIRKKKHT